MPEQRHNLALNVLASSRSTKRQVGPLAWILLEELALRAERHTGELLVRTTVRDLAADLMVGKDAVATALGRLVDLGLIRCHARRRAGRYAGTAYVLDVDACRAAGLVLGTVDGVARPCPLPPCPIEPDTAQPAPVDPATTSEARPGHESGPARRHEPSAQSLFDVPEPPTSPTPSPPSSFLRPTSHSDRPSSPSSFLPPSSQPDTSAPEVRSRGVGSL